MRKINEIIVHCTATPAGREVTVQDIDRWHRTRGFRCIGYHYLVRLDGSVEDGRDIRLSGAHCYGHNLHSIGVAYVGGIDADGQPADTRTPRQRHALRQLLADLKGIYPAAHIRSHRDFANKACPCFDATTEYADL
ncbi:MAG: N-acetylmuramoyl-L-alanine amidase [Bacteroidales bacterium]|nr:N-acetylmuramoyl-L-alanine amidase [Bacteroidales bacterium]